jgi:hypothetical protein
VAAAAYEQVVLPQDGAVALAPRKVAQRPVAPELPHRGAEYPVNRVDARAVRPDEERLVAAAHVDTAQLALLERPREEVDLQPAVAVQLGGFRHVVHEADLAHCALRRVQFQGRRQLRPDGEGEHGERHPLGGHFSRCEGPHVVTLNPAQAARLAAAPTQGVPQKFDGVVDVVDERPLTLLARRQPRDARDRISKVRQRLATEVPGCFSPAVHSRGVPGVAALVAPRSGGFVVDQCVRIRGRRRRIVVVVVTTTLVGSSSSSSSALIPRRRDDASVEHVVALQLHHPCQVHRGARGAGAVERAGGLGEVVAEACHGPATRRARLEEVPTERWAADVHGHALRRHVAAAAEDAHERRAHARVSRQRDRLRKPVVVRTIPRSA